MGVVLAAGLSFEWIGGLVWGEVIAAGFILGLLRIAGGFVEDTWPFSQLLSRLPKDTSVGAYLSRMLDDGKPFGIGYGIMIGALLGALGAGLVALAGIAVVLGLFWAVPTVVWLSVLHDVPLGDAISYAAVAANGNPEYSIGPINNDPSIIGVFIFTVIGWAVILAVLAIPLLPFWLLWRWREKRKFDRWLAEYNETHKV